MNDEASKAKALLLELEVHPGGVAEALRILGVTGRRGSASCCPVSRYLGRHGIQAWITAKEVQQSAVLDEKPWRFETPPAIARFVKTFDGGYRFPFLDSTRQGEHSEDM